jgi:transmembrane sensor
MDIQLLQKYLKGTCTPEEAILVREWLNDPDSEDQLEALAEQEWQAGPAGTDPVMMTTGRNMWTRLLTSIRLHDKEQRSAILQSVKKIAVRYWAAAAILLVLFTGGWQYWLHRASSAKAAPAWLNIDNASSLVKHVIMPDGTHIWVNGFSSISYPEDYGMQKRLVALKGEAYFDIAADEARPFLVNSGGLQTQVLGTAFNIEAYPSESTVKISLVKGKIAVRPVAGKQATLQLKPGQMLSFDRKKARYALSGIPAREVQAWISGSMVFNDVPLAEALHRIEKRYDIQLRFDSADMKGKQITTTIKAADWQKTLRHVLFVHDYSFVQNKDTVLVIKK